MPVFFTNPLSTITTKWRIFHEESAELNPRDEKTDFEELRGKGDSRIYRHGQAVLAVSTDYSPRQKMLSRISGLTPKNGSVFLFPDTLLDTVAEAIEAKRKVNYSPERRAAAAERMRALRQAQKMN